MKNKKLNLNELKVKSFVTDLENEKEKTVKGGGPFDTPVHSFPLGCPGSFYNCTWNEWCITNFDGGPMC